MVSTLNSKRLPDFFILGAAKAGTTTLYDVLRKHPQVYMPVVKEPMFFSKDQYYEKGLDWYARTFFSGAEKFQTRGEASPHYLYWSEKVAPRLSKIPGQPIKLIVSLRDPVYRAYSGYWDSVREGQENEIFEKALALEAERLESRQSALQSAGLMHFGYYLGGCYATLLKPFLEFFPMDSFFFLLQNDLHTNYRKTCQDLFKFLNIDENIAVQPVQKNMAAMPRNRTIHTWLKKQNGLREWLKMFIPLQTRYQVKQKLLNANLTPAKYPPMNNETEAALRLRYCDEMMALNPIINRDLSAWLPK